MANRNHIQGKGFGGRHTTIIDAAVDVVTFVSKLPSCSKIVPGFITMGLRSGAQKRVRIKDMIGGVMIVVRGSASIQELRAYGDPEDLRQSLESEFVQ